MPTVDTRNPNTIVGKVHVRDTGVVVGPPVSYPGAAQVLYLQVVGGPLGVGIAFNGTAYALTPNLTASLKKGLDAAVAGLVM